MARADRYSAKRTSHNTTFSCFAPTASRVALVGDFNDWDANSHPMNRMPDGGWVLTLVLYHGHHQYFFLIDGEPALDPRASGTVYNRHGQRASLLAVS